MLSLSRAFSPARSHTHTHAHRLLLPGLPRSVTIRGARPVLFSQSTGIGPAATHTRQSQHWAVSKPWWGIGQITFQDLKAVSLSRSPFLSLSVSPSLYLSLPLPPSAFLTRSLSRAISLSLSCSLFLSFSVCTSTLTQFICARQSSFRGKDTYQDPQLWYQDPQPGPPTFVKAKLLVVC